MHALAKMLQIQARPQLFVVDRQQLIWERGEVNTVARLRNTVERLLSGDTLIEDRLCVSDIPQGKTMVWMMGLSVFM